MHPEVRPEHKHRSKDRPSVTKSKHSKPNWINMSNKINNQSSKMKFNFKESLMADKGSNFIYDGKSSNNPLR